jgi:hypothetical protein
LHPCIYQADLVIADLLTLTTHVFDEFGVRHALRPNTTTIVIVIAESVLLQRIPVDLSSFVVRKYGHGDEATRAAEAQRFAAHVSGGVAQDGRDRNAPPTRRARNRPRNRQPGVSVSARHDAIRLRR